MENNNLQTSKIVKHKTAVQDAIGVVYRHVVGLFDMLYRTPNGHGMIDAKYDITISQCKVLDELHMLLKLIDDVNAAVDAEERLQRVEEVLKHDHGGENESHD